jgi:DNA-binding MarR family transcriptional regulator
MSKSQNSQNVSAAERATCLCFHAQRAARSLGRRFDDAFRLIGLTNGQYSLLAALSQCEPLSIGGLATALGMDRTTMTAALKPLSRRRLVKVTIDPADRRNRLVAMTKSGAATLGKARPIWRATHCEVEKLLSAGGADRLRRDLRALF